MAKRETREEKAARLEAEGRAKKVAEFKQRVADARSMRTYSKDLLFNGGSDRDPIVGVLYDLLHRYESASDSLKQRMASLRQQLEEAQARLDDNRHDAFSWSNPIATVGSDIEKAHHVRMALADAVATLGRATGWWTPQVFDTRTRARHAQLCSFEVVARGSGTFQIMREGKAMTAADFGEQGEQAQLVRDYATEEAAWLAADAFHGQW